MKKILVAFSLLITSIVAYAQLNNSWIDYNKTYYKFKVAQNGLYRINGALLSSVGLGNTPGNQFQLWRNGKNVRIYASQSAIPLGNNDYIEFWGEMNDGIPDKTLYRDSTFQLNDKSSLSSDSAAYYLTTNASAQNPMYVTAPNNTASTTLYPEAYFMQRIEYAYKSTINAGNAVNLGGDLLYTSEYDLGEGWTSSQINGCCFYQSLSNLNVYAGGPLNNVSLTLKAAGNTASSRDFHVKLTNTVIYDTTLVGFAIINKKISNLPLSALLNSSGASLSITTNSSDPNDNSVVGQFSLTYPSTFNFNNQPNFYFELPATPQGNYLVITNFKNNNIPPVLYDKNAGNRYIGDISTAGQVKFLLPASTDPIRRFVLVSEDVSNINTINALTQKKFVNYANVANQGSYIIISNPILYNDGHGINNVEKYRQYRASLAGGAYNAVTVPIDEITDQFAFGINKHPVAIRDFIRYAYQNFTIKPQYIFLIGAGIDANNYAINNNINGLLINSALGNQLNLIPTFGWPASDVLLACNPGQNVPLIPIGRLSAVNGTEVGYYLQKMIEYEAAQSSPSQTFNDKGWMKNFIHLAGGGSVTDNAEFLSDLNSYKSIAVDTLYGASVQTFQKSSVDPIEQANGAIIQQSINNGLSFIGYFGHASSTSLGYSLGTPQSYNNQGKYYFFNVSGCIAGDNFEYDNTRLTIGPGTLSEKFTLAPERGCIGFLGSTYLGVPYDLNVFNKFFYKEFCFDLYGNTVGNQLKKVYNSIVQSYGNNINSPNSFIARCNLEQVNLEGDPALKINSFSLPDYDIEDQFVSTNPSIISVANTNFTVNVKWVNLGKAINDSMRVLVQRKLPNGTLQILYNTTIFATKYSDSLKITVPVNPITDVGTNQIIISLDADNKIAELSKTNNNLTKTFQIFASELLPIYPYNYSIINQQNITYSSSTANPLEPQSKYLMEIDTTLFFNSPSLKQYSVNGIGGIIQFTPTNITFIDSTVYYWRTTIVPNNINTPAIWSWYSFVYLPTGGTGFNQSNYYQHLQSTYSNISLPTNRVFNFNQKNSSLIINTGIYPATGNQNINVTLDFNMLDSYGCLYNSLQFMVYDSATLTPMPNYNVGNSGRFNSVSVCSRPIRYFFEFPYNTAAGRKNAINFLDSIPSGKFVSITNLGNIYYDTATIYTWKADQATLGAGNDLYHKLKALGFSQIDSFTSNIPFVFFYQKNNPNYNPWQSVGASPTSRINAVIPVLTSLNFGTIQSPLFGPAKKWTSLHWRGKSIDAGAGDSVQIQVYGIKKDGSSNLLATVAPATDTSLAYISAVTYPYLQLKMLNTDTVYATPNQLQYWRINADYLPEGAIAPNISFTLPDTFALGQKIPVLLAFKNISPVAFDSLQTLFVITDANNVTHTIPIAKGKALVSGDTLLIRDTIDSKLYKGLNTLYVMFNPNNSQPEQYLFNNFLYKNFYVKTENINPFLDVTFNGEHILDKDIVSAKPNILIKLSDASKYLALVDTNLIQVQIVFPDGTYHTYPFSDSMRFIPANLATGVNVASIELLPTFSQDGVYQLIVNAHDESNNNAGNISYKVSFSVINKAMISNLLNYPNPFTTSTAFVFTLTGTQIPQNMRIQILTITGKVVKEILQNELGPIHIGTNITEYKWNGTDKYGQKLANGVYLYRVLTNLNGKSLDKYNGTDGNGNIVTQGIGSTDKYFTKGYGKMYLMR